MKKGLKTVLVVFLAVASLIGGVRLVDGGIQPLTAYANTCPGDNVTANGRGVTCNQNTQVRVYLNWWRPTWGGQPMATAGVRTRTNQSRRLRVNVRWYDVWDIQRSASGWQTRPDVVPVGQRIASGVYWGDALVWGRSSDGRFRASSQRMLHNQTSWNTSSAGTVNQSRSWNMR